jgi:hypothetical protein
MALLPSASGAMTIFDWAQRIDPDGKIAAFAMMLSQQNEMLFDMPFIEGNLPTGHQASIETGLPTVVFRKLYQGVPPSKGSRATVTDLCGIAETRSEIDKAVADLNGNTREFRAGETKRFIEAMNQRVQQAAIYGDASINPEEFNGFAVRYNTINVNNSELANNTISAGGSGNCTSVWLVGWGDEVTGIFPKGSKAGLEVEDLGVFDAFDANNRRFRAVGERYEWKPGLHIRDWRYVVRICNISVSDLLAGTGTQAPTASTNLLRLMSRAQALVPGSNARFAFYGNRQVKGALAAMALDRSQSVLSVQDAFEQFGKLGPGFPTKQLEFLGTPIRTVDRILSTETALT